MNKKIWTLIIFFLGFNHLVMGQPPRGPFIISPQVNHGNMVTFRYLAPGAKEVMLSAQFEKGLVPMVKDSQGIWSITVGPISPDIYPYSFRVDGVTVMDPANVAYFPNERFKASLADIPGETPLIHALRDVPHGTINYEYYASIQGSTGSLLVYTPPGYGINPTIKYPVYYLISGTTDTEETFFKVSKTNLIMDNLIAEGKARPMIIVMPYGNPMARIAEQTGGSKLADPANRDSDEAIARAKAFETDLISRVIPYIDKHYQTLSDRQHRAIGGFSRGGGQTLRTGFGHLDRFAWICSYSSYLSSAEMEKSFSSIIQHPDYTNSQLKLLWLSVGNEDFLYKGATEFMDFLSAKHIQYKKYISDGGHTWMNVKKYLAETLPLLFKQ